MPSNSPDSPPGGEEAYKPSRLPPLLAALRPKQWTKNALLFAGVLFAFPQSKSPTQDLLHALIGFALFCLLSGSTYLINDILDVEADRKHPKKRHRPIAAGRLSIPVAWAFAGIGIPGAVGAAFFLGVKFGLAALCYLILTLTYSFVLKHVVLVDVIALASLFVIRAAAGAFAIAVPISEWLLFCTLLLALFLGLAKRRGELAALGDKPATRKILAEYSLPMLEQMITIVASACIMAYTLYTFYSPTGQKRPYLMATVPFVIYGLFRYLYLTHKKGTGESPETVLLEDKPLLVNVFLWGIVALIVLQLGR